MIVGRPAETGRGLARRPAPRLARVATALLVAVGAGIGAAQMGYLPNSWLSPSQQGGTTPGEAIEDLRPEQLTSDIAQLVAITPDEARLRNVELPYSGVPVTAAASLSLVSAQPVDLSRSLDCMTAAIYYEAANESEDGQRAVAQVILNRVRHPMYPKTICGVVYQGHERSTGCQFTFTCDGSLARKPMPGLWARARRVAAGALSGSVYAPVGWATNYHANYVLPRWAGSLLKTATIGTHIFYRLPYRGAEARAFALAYHGNEPMPSAQDLITPLPEQGGPPTPQMAMLGDRPVIENGTTDATRPAPVITGAAGSRWIIGSDAPRRDVTLSVVDVMPVIPKAVVPPTSE